MMIINNTTNHMKSTKTIFVLLLAVLALTGCKSDDSNDNNVPVQPTEVVTLNVDVILPANIREEWQATIDWAQENIAKAQKKLARQVKLNLRYHNEDTEDISALGMRLSELKGADSCHAIIGPYHSSNAQDILKWAKQSRLPVVMPTCTSSELQRIYSKSTFAWFLTESDITQCEMMITAADASGATDVALIYSDDVYGRSFYDWFAYYAAELDINIAGDGFTTYKSGDDLSAFFDNIKRGAKGNSVKVCVALSNAKDYADVGRQLMKDLSAPLLIPIFADTSLSREFIHSWNPDNIFFSLGICPYASMDYGFPQVYDSHFGRMPSNGEAQVYDALTIIALGAAHQLASPDKCLVDGKQVVYTEKPYTTGLTDYMRAVVSSEAGLITQWDEVGLNTAFSELYNGRSINVTGATGNLYFDKETQTKILNTTYMEWRLNEEEYRAGASTFNLVEPVIFLSTLGTSSEASTTLLWLQQKMWEQEFDDVHYERQRPDITDRWAIVISPSTTWSNYRHQADAFAMYQMLKRHGYEDDHIVLIVEDNLAYDERNKAFSGQIFVEREGDTFLSDDVRKDAIVDYHFSDLTIDDIGDIMLGRQSERLPKVIHSTASSNVFFFWSGHGGAREGPLWGNEDANTYFGTARIRNIVEQMFQDNRYRRMMFAIETCYSGKWGEALTGMDDVLVLTAANPHETSKADVHDKQLGVYLSNAFARTFRLDIERTPGISLHTLYTDLARATTGSHVTLYNQHKYGTVYHETMNEFFPK